MTWRTFRCKGKSGLSCKWSIGQNKEGRWEIMSLGNVKNGRLTVPSAFVPFELSNAVMNGPEFSTAEEAERYVRSL